VVPEVAGMWVEPIENPNIRAITGDSCMRRDGTGKMVARCLFNLKGSSLKKFQMIIYSHLYPPIRTIDEKGFQVY